MEFPAAAVERAMTYQQVIFRLLARMVLRRVPSAQARGSELC
jgi:hypothetical protein